MKLSKKGIAKFIIDIIFLISVTYFPPYIFTQDFWRIFQIARILVQITIIITLIPRTIKLFKKIDVIIISFYAAMLLSTLIHQNGSQLVEAVQPVIACISICTYFKYRLEKSKTSFMRNLIIVWGALLAINAFTMIIFAKQESMYGKIGFYFLGNDNATIFESFSLILYSAIYFFAKGEKVPLYMYLLYGFILISYIVAWSGNAMVITALMILAIPISKNPVVHKIFNARNVVIAFALFFLTFIVARSQNSISVQVLTSLGKDATYSGRTTIWNRMSPYIRDNIIIGNGAESISVARKKYGNMKAHNIFIEALYDGGIVELALLVIVLIYMLRQDKYNQFVRLELRTFLNISLLLFLIMNCFDYDITRYVLVYFLMIKESFCTLGKNTLKMENTNEKSIVNYI